MTCSGIRCAGNAQNMQCESNFLRLLENTILSLCFTCKSKTLMILLISIFILDFGRTKVEADEANFVGAFYKLEDVLGVFKNEKHKDDPAASKVMQLYEALMEDVGNTSQYEIDNPFIAVEGNHRSRRFVVARQLSRALRAKNLRNPPEFMNFLKFAFKDVETRRAFYSLCIYANALEAIRILPNQPVVTAGYWLDIAAFSLAKKYPTYLPEKNSSDMTWPKDLLAPDVIFYINTPIKSQENSLIDASTIPPNPIKPRLVEIYRHWTYPRVVELNEHVFSYSEMFTEMFRHINFIKQNKVKQYLKSNSHMYNN